VKGIVEAHGGQIGVHSNWEKAFFFSIPDSCGSLSGQRPRPELSRPRSHLSLAGVRADSPREDSGSSKRVLQRSGQRRNACCIQHSALAHAQVLRLMSLRRNGCAPRASSSSARREKPSN
jgi:hypothetical protein